MYKIDKLNELAKIVAEKRAENAALEPRRMTAEEKDDLLAHFHPDYKQDEFTVLSAGVNKGDKVPTQLAALLQGKSRITAADADLENPDYDTDVLIIGGGGAGASAAIEADEAGVKAMIVTKLRIGDANTMMAEGGIQAADKPNDSPAIHFLDAFGGGHFAAKPELVAKLVTKAPEAIQWLNKLGVEFDKEADGTMVTTHGGGTSRKRMHAAKDYSGAEIMRTLRDEVINRGIPVVDFTAAVEIILDENGRAAGAVLMNMETKQLLVARAKTVIIATGGAGRLQNDEQRGDLDGSVRRDTRQADRSRAAGRHRRRNARAERQFERGIVQTARLFDRRVDRDARTVREVRSQHESDPRRHEEGRGRVGEGRRQREGRLQPVCTGRPERNGLQCRRDRNIRSACRRDHVRRGSEGAAVV